MNVSGAFSVSITALHAHTDISCPVTAGRSPPSGTGGPSILGQCTNACCSLMDAGLPPGTITLPGTQADTHIHKHKYRAVYMQIYHILQKLHSSYRRKYEKLTQLSSSKHIIHGCQLNILTNSKHNQASMACWHGP